MLAQLHLTEVVLKCIEMYVVVHCIEISYGEVAEGISFSRRTLGRSIEDRAIDLVAAAGLTQLHASTVGNDSVS